MLQEFFAKGRASQQEGTLLYTTRVRITGVPVDVQLIRYEDGEIDFGGDGLQIEKVFRYAHRLK